MAITTFKLVQNAKVGGVWKICYKMGTEIFIIEEEMTEKMKPKVGNMYSSAICNYLVH